MTGPAKLPPALRPRHCPHCRQVMTVVVCGFGLAHVQHLCLDVPCKLAQQQQPPATPPVGLVRRSA